MIVAGFGFTSRATAHSLRAALSATQYKGPIDRIATASDKATAPAISDTAADMNLSICAVDPAALTAVQTLTHSPASQAARHTGSVAEAAALAAAGPGATLIVRRHISDDRMATCAIAKGGDT